MQSKSRKKSKWFDDFEVLKDWKRRKVRPEFWGVNEAPKSLHHFHRVILKNLHWLPPLRFWTVLGKYLKNNLCKFHIRSWVVTRVRTDCLTPTLHVASMGSALVVYTLEGTGPTTRPTHAHKGRRCRGWRNQSNLWLDFRFRKSIFRIGQICRVLKSAGGGGQLLFYTKNVRYFSCSDRCTWSENE